MKIGEDARGPSMGYIGWPSLKRESSLGKEMIHECAILHSNPETLSFLDSKGTWGH